MKQRHRKPRRNRDAPSPKESVEINSAPDSPIKALIACLWPRKFGRFAVICAGGVAAVAASVSLLPETVRTNLMYRFGLATPTEWIKVMPPPDLPALGASFKPPQPSPTASGKPNLIDLKLYLYRGGVNTNFQVDDRVKVSELYSRILSHFRLQESVVYDWSVYPLPQHILTSPFIVMKRNGQLAFVPNPLESGFESMRKGDLVEWGFQSGDIVTFAVEVQTMMQVSDGYTDSERWFSRRWDWRMPEGGPL